MLLNNGEVLAVTGDTTDANTTELYNPGNCYTQSMTPGAGDSQYISVL